MVKRVITRHRLVFTAIFVSTFLLSCFGLWLHNLYQQYNEVRSPLETYVRNHQEELKEKVFDGLFLDAKACSQISEKTVNEECRAKITHELALTIIEEEFGHGWPNDLFFVKQDNGRFYRMGWGAEYEDVTSSVNLNTMPYFLKVLTGNCKEFKPTLDELSDCSISKSIELSDSNKGYIVRRARFVEENDLVFNIIVPIVASFILVKMLIMGEIHYQPNLNFFFIASLPFYIAVLVTVTS